MELLARALRTPVEWALRPLDLLPPILSLTVIGLVTALLMLVVVKRASPQALIQKARDRMAGAIYEMRLFLDAPGRVLRAQGRLIGWMVVYLVALLPALLVLGPPLALLYLHLEPRHGIAPIEAPATVVLRVGLAAGTDGDAVQIDTPAGVERTAPLVYAADEPAVYARLRITEPATHTVTVRAGEAQATKQIVADPDAVQVAPARAAGAGHFLSLGPEPPPAAPFTSLSIPHQPSDQSWLALPIPWWLYWLGVATILALLLRRRFDVAF